MKKLLFIGMALCYLPCQVWAGIDYSGLMVTSPKVKVLYSALGDDLANPDRKTVYKMADQACQEKVKQFQSEGKEVLGYEIRQESLYWKDIYANCNILISTPENSE